MPDVVEYVRRIRVSDKSCIPEFILHYLAEICDEDYTAQAGTKHLSVRFHLSPDKIDKALGVLGSQGLITIDATYCPYRQGFEASRIHLHGPWDDYNGSGVPFIEYTNTDCSPPGWATKMWRGRSR